MRKRTFTVEITTTEEAFAESGPHTRDDVVSALHQMFPTTIEEVQVWDDKGTSASFKVGK